jgi:hypothetical protein
MKRIMKRGWNALFTAWCLTGVLLFAAPASADVVTDWNERALAAIAQSGESPMRAALTLATVHAAVYESVNSIDGDRHLYRRHVPDARGASAEAASSAAFISIPATRRGSRSAGRSVPT